MIMNYLILHIIFGYAYIYIYITYNFRVYNLLKDFCGLVTEGSLDKNMILVYEILDEMFVSTMDHLSSFPYI